MKLAVIVFAIFTVACCDVTAPTTRYEDHVVRAQVYSINQTQVLLSSPYGIISLVWEFGLFEGRHVDVTVREYLTGDRIDSVEFIRWAPAAQ